MKRLTWPLTSLLLRYGHLGPEGFDRPPTRLGPHGEFGS